MQDKSVENIIRKLNSIPFPICIEFANYADIFRNMETIILAQKEAILFLLEKYENKSVAGVTRVQVKDE